MSRKSGRNNSTDQIINGHKQVQAAHSSDTAVKLTMGFCNRASSILLFIMLSGKDPWPVQRDGRV